MSEQPQSKIPPAILAFSSEFARLGRYEKLALIAAPFLIALCAWMQVIVPPESDKAWLLHAARMWLEGRRLYIDIIEANPPLIIWFYSIPVWLSMHVPGLADYQALGMLGVGLSLCVMEVCRRLIRLHPGFDGSTLRQWEFVLLLGMIFLFYTTQLYFFDRDDIFYIMTFPYVVRFMPALAEQKIPRNLRLCVAFMGALGFCIKPHAIILFAALQLFALIRRRSFAALLNLENYIIIGAGALYLALVSLLTPDFFWVIIPLEVTTYSEFANHGEWSVYMPPLLGSVGLVFCDFNWRHTTPYRRDVPYFFGVCMAFFAYSLANNGWGYTYNPSFCITIFVAGWMLWDYNWLKAELRKRHASVAKVVFGIRGCLIVLLLHTAYIVMYLNVMLATLPQVAQECRSGPHCWRSGSLIDYFERNHIRSFGTISLDFSKWVLLLRIPGTDWQTRFNHVWMLPKLINNGKAYTEEHRWVLDYVGKSLAQDMNTRKPQVMITDSSPGFMGLVRRFDYGVYLSQVPEFKEAWSHYRYDATLDECPVAMQGIPTECRYDVYVRKP